MNVCCIVLQETSQINASGVVSLITALVSNWPSQESKHLMILCNKGHWAYEEFYNLKINGKIGFFETSPSFTITNKINRVKNSNRYPKFVKLLIRILYVLQPFFYILAIIRLRRLFIDYNVDVVFSHNGGYPGGTLNRIAVIAARMGGVKKNYMIMHNLSEPVPKISIWRWIVEDHIVARSVNRLFTVSKTCAEDLEHRRFFNIPIDIIYNGIKVNCAMNALKVPTAPHWKGEVPAIIFVGEIHFRKGLNVLFDAIAGLNSRTSLILYGDGEGEYLAFLRQKADELGISERVYFEGYCKYAAKMIQYCDLLVLPAVAYESFGMVLLEAMNWKKPVICSDHGGMKEIVIHEQTGLIVPAGDAEALRDAMQYILDNPAHAKQWGINGYKRLKEHFDIKFTVERYRQLI